MAANMQQRRGIKARHVSVRLCFWTYVKINEVEHAQARRPSAQLICHCVMLYLLSSERSLP